MVYLIESLGKINSTEIYSTARSNKAVDNVIYERYILRGYIQDAF